MKIAAIPSIANKVLKHSRRFRSYKFELTPSRASQHQQDDTCVEEEEKITPKDNIEKAPNKKEETAINPRRFQVSKTCANAIFPLKISKLANPFPDPVRTMFSRTVSDAEKAEQMFADSKCQQNFYDFTNTNNMANSYPQQRLYSTSFQNNYREIVENKTSKCKKFDFKKEETCFETEIDNAR